MQGCHKVRKNKKKRQKSGKKGGFEKSQKI